MDKWIFLVQNSLILAIRDELYAYAPHAIGQASFDRVGQLEDRVGSLAFDLTGNVYVQEPDEETIFYYDLEKKTRDIIE